MYLGKLVDIYFFELGNFGLEEYFQSLAIGLENILVIVLEGYSAVVSGVKH